jgi:hypothetical protein
MFGTLPIFICIFGFLFIRVNSNNKGGILTVRTQQMFGTLPIIWIPYFLEQKITLFNCAFPFLTL